MGVIKRFFGGETNWEEVAKSRQRQQEYLSEMIANKNKKDREEIERRLRETEEWFLNNLNKSISAGKIESGIKFILEVAQEDNSAGLDTNGIKLWDLPTYDPEQKLGIGLVNEFSKENIMSLFKKYEHMIPKEINPYYLEIWEEERLKQNYIKEQNNLSSINNVVDQLKLEIEKLKLENKKITIKIQKLEEENKELKEALDHSYELDNMSVDELDDELKRLEDEYKMI